MKKLVLIFSVLALLFSPLSTVNAQNPEDEGLWKILLNDITVRYRYSFKTQSFIPRPVFGDQIRGMEGQTITLDGFYLPASITGSSFVLSYFPMAMCFYCTGAGMESVVLLDAAEGEERKFSALRTDDFIEVSGRLELNDDATRGLFYLLRDARLIRIYK